MCNKTRRYCNNGIINKVYYDEKDIPEGFVPGRVKGVKVKRHYYNNGVSNQMFYEDEPIPEGWVPGMVERTEEQKAHTLEVRKQTVLNKWGVENVFQHPEVQERQKQTNLERYGVENSFQSEVCKEKSRQTNLKNLGVEYPTQSEDIKEKSKQTSLKNWGVEHPMQSLVIRSKVINTCLRVYGSTSPAQSDEVKEKAKKTSLERWGYEYPSQSPVIKTKILNRFIENYGGNPLSLNTYDNPSKVPEVKEKKRQTSLKNFGVECSFQSEVCKEKAKQTCLEKYGTVNPAQSDIVKEKTKQTNMEKYGYPWTCMRPEARFSSNHSNSKPNTDFANLLDSYNIFYKREFSLSGYSYDFKVGNTLIEINPYSTHNSLWHAFQGKGISENYHQQKSQAAKNNGYHCIHIFDWDNPEKIIKSLLVAKEKIYARNTKVFGVTKQEVRDFENEYHLQGYCNGQEVCLGLKDKFGNLVSVMTFGKSRYNKKYQWELLRYCSSKSVVGGAQKLFKYFVDNYNPDSIISYCDMAKFNGNVYPTLGFKLLNSGSPSCHWYEPKSQKHFTDNLVRQRGFDQLMNANYGKGTSNEELLIQHGFVPIYDCGQDTYVWNK